MFLLTELAEERRISGIYTGSDRLRLNLEALQYM